MPLTNAEEKLLETFYYEEGYTLGRDTLYEELVEKHPNTHPSRREVMRWLKDQEIYQRYRGAKKSGGISSFKPIKPLNSLSADLIDFTNKPARQFRYILVVIDNFSRYMWTRAITSKEPTKTAPAMRDILKEISKNFDGKKIAYIQTDDGGEFKADFLKLLKEKNIKSVKTLAGQPQSNSLVERANGKVKSVMFKNKAIVGGSWYDRLEKATDVYNSYTNRTIGFAPIDAIKDDKETQEKVKENSAKIAIKNKTVTPPVFKVGQKVRLKITKGALDKGLSTPNWSAKVYTITKVTKGKGVRPTKYKLDNNKEEKSYTFNDVLAIDKVEESPQEKKKKVEAAKPKTRATTQKEALPKRTQPKRKAKDPKDSGVVVPASEVKVLPSNDSGVVVPASKVKVLGKTKIKTEPKIKSEPKEYIVERILSNNPSKKTARVKWKGYKKSTEEPVESIKNTEAWIRYKKTKTYKK